MVEYSILQSVALAVSLIFGVLQYVGVGVLLLAAGKQLKKYPKQKAFAIGCLIIGVVSLVYGISQIPTTVHIFYSFY